MNCFAKQGARKASSDNLRTLSNTEPFWHMKSPCQELFNVHEKTELTCYEDSF